MPQRHSKNNNDLAFFTYDERKKLGYGTQRERLGRDSIKPFDACCICLKSLITPLCCTKGHLFCKECIYQCLLAQKKDIKRKVALFEAQHKEEQERETERKQAERERELDAFDQQNSSALPHYDRTSAGGGGSAANPNGGGGGGGFHGANSVRVTSYEEEALRTMKAFWLPSATPEAPQRVQLPSTDTFCPEGKEKLKLKELFDLRFSEAPAGDGGKDDGGRYWCPSCSVVFTNTLTLVAIVTCGHVYCKKCTDQFVAADRQCMVCNTACKRKNLVVLEKGGTGFSGHGDELEAKSFKHVGSGTGMGLSRPTTRL